MEKEFEESRRVIDYTQYCEDEAMARAIAEEEKRGLRGEHMQDIYGVDLPWL